MSFQYMIFKSSWALDLYHEGLWNMKDSLFWTALIFETPFVLLKLVPLIIAIIFGISFYKAYRKRSMLRGK